MKKTMKERLSVAAKAIATLGGPPLLEAAILKTFDLPMSLVTDAMFVKPVNEDGFVKVSFADIDWIEADRSYTHIHLHGNRHISITGNIGKMESCLPKRIFVRVSRSEIVNIHKVEKIIGNMLSIGGHKAHITENYRKYVSSCFFVLGNANRGDTHT